MTSGPARLPSRYVYSDGRPSHTHDYLRPGLHRFLAGQAPGRLFEIGCGNGAMAASLRDLGFDVVAIDSSESGIDQARAHHPGIRFEVGSGYDDLSTPYHGYLKNLALAVSGKMDSHFTALWDGGHIKFWSMATLATLLRETGFVDLEFRRVGRIPWLAKSMTVTARRPVVIAANAP